MPKIEWDESFSVNNADIDGQHKKWIEIFNNMHGILTGGDIDALQNIGADTLNAMQEYAQKHFKFEEEYMRKINYPELYTHKRQHEDFDNQIYVYSRAMREGRLVLNSEIMQMIRNWLLEHIGIEDKQYALFSAREN